MSISDVVASLPRQIRIGPYRYTVTVHDDWLMDEDGRHWGDCCNSTLVIRVGNVASITDPAFLAATLLHEILHGLWYTRDIGTKPREEAIVANFEKGLIDLFRDNPDLVKWLAEAVA